MVFSTLPFVYGFFPVVFVLYFIWNNRAWRNVVLLAASLVFYAWGEPRLLDLMLLATLEAYVGGLLMERWKDDPKRKKAAFTVTVVLLVANLFVFKYLNFVGDNLGLLLGSKLPLPAITLPIGISFYTFQVLSYVIDLYWGRVKVQRHYFYLLLYVSFFPQLIAGPIVRYQTVEHEIRTRHETLDDAAAGMRRFIQGLAKKAIMANAAGALAELIYAGDPALYGTAMYWVAAVAYTLQIYFDFSGYSDMAIGLGRIFGFHFLENFDHPYIAASITEFWRRWHISLSTWFRDYIYIPLGGNRVGKPRWMLNIFIVWGLTGFWHGAQWNFLLWGLYYAVLLLVEKLWLQKWLDKLPKLVGWLYAMFFVVVGWVLFNLTDFSRLLAALGQMFIYRPTDWVGMAAADMSVLYGLFFIPLGLVWMLPLPKKLRLSEYDSPWALALNNLLHLALAGVCIIFIISSKYNPFIYFRF